MYERSTNSSQQEKTETIYTPTKAADHKGMGTDRRRCDGSPKSSDSSQYPLSLAQTIRARCRDLSQRQAPANRSAHPAIGRRESKAQRSVDHPNPRADAVKKKDELGLTNRQKGTIFSSVQQTRIIDEIEKFKAAGIAKTAALKSLGVCRSTYYGWLQPCNTGFQRESILRLTDAEREAVIKQKKAQPQLSHRKISGYIRSDGFWVSPSSCYRILKALGWVESQKLGEAPWKVAHYEPYRPNQIWGEDWTILTINGKRHYLLTIIDYFSRYIVAWGIVKSVTQIEVRNLVALAYMCVVGANITKEAIKAKARLRAGILAKLFTWF